MRNIRKFASKMGPGALAAQQIKSLSFSKNQICLGEIGPAKLKNRCALAIYLFLGCFKNVKNAKRWSKKCILKKNLGKTIFLNQNGMFMHSSASLVQCMTTQHRILWLLITLDRHVCRCSSVFAFFKYHQFLQSQSQFHLYICFAS